MNKRRLKAVWMGIMLGALVGTAPTWLNPNYHVTPGYEAPWIYPSQEAH